MVTQGNKAQQLPLVNSNTSAAGSLAVQRYEEVTLNLQEGNWKSVVNGDFFRPNFHLFNNKVSMDQGRKEVGSKKEEVLLSCVTMTN